MEIYDLKINGIRTPLGFELPWVSVSWKVREAVSKYAVKSSISVASDALFAHPLFKKEDRVLNSAGELAELSLQPRTRYYVRVEITGDAGDTGCGETFFETGKMD